jgi:Skp family chaperone for outer membrane proteins
VAADSGYDAPILRDRLSKLVTLYDTTETLKGQIQAVRYRQTSAVWPTGIPSVQAVAAQYKDSLRAIEEQLDAIRDTIEACRQALSDSALSLDQQDAAVDELMSQLEKRLEPAPVTPTGYGRTPQVM